MTMVSAEDKSQEWGYELQVWSRDGTETEDILGLFGGPGFREVSCLSFNWNQRSSNTSE